MTRPLASTATDRTPSVMPRCARDTAKNRGRVRGSMRTRQFMDNVCQTFPDRSRPCRAPDPLPASGLLLDRYPERKGGGQALAKEADLSAIALAEG